MIKLELFLKQANFRISFIGTSYDTYHIPPPSTIYGLLRYITNYEHINMNNTKLSIQAYHESSDEDIGKKIIYTKGSKNKKGIYDDPILNTNVRKVTWLRNVHLIIHIESKKEYEDLILKNYKKIYRIGIKENLVSAIKVNENLQTNFDYDYFTICSSKKTNGCRSIRCAMDTVYDKKENKITGYSYERLFYNRIMDTKKELKKDKDGRYYNFI